MRRRGKSIAIGSAALGVLTLAVAGFFLQDHFIEEYWIRKLGSDVASERLAAAERLGAMGSVRAVPHLIRMQLRSGEDLFHVFTEIAFQRKAELTGALIGQLARGGDPRARCAAARLLAGHAWKHPAAVEALRKSLSDDDASVRDAAAAALEEIEKERQADGRPRIGVLMAERPWGTITVVQTIDGGPVARAGLRAGDVIEKLDGKPLMTPGELLAVLNRFEPGDIISITVRRDGDRFERKIVLTSRPQPPLLPATTLQSPEIR